MFLYIPSFRYPCHASLDALVEVHNTFLFLNRPCIDDHVLQLVEPQRSSGYVHILSTNLHMNDSNYTLSEFV